MADLHPEQPGCKIQHVRCQLTAAKLQLARNDPAAAIQLLNEAAKLAKTLANGGTFEASIAKLRSEAESMR